MSTQYRETLYEDILQIFVQKMTDRYKKEQRSGLENDLKVNADLH